MRIQATISGFTGEAVTLLSVLHEDTGVLVIAKKVRFREERIEAPEGEPQFAVVTNLDLPDMDMRFTDAHLRNAIRDYFTRRAQGTLDMAEGVRQFEPDQRIEQDGVDENGRRYRISSDISNAQIAVLATVAFISNQGGIRAVTSAMDELAEFYRVTRI